MSNSIQISVVDSSGKQYLVRAMILDLENNTDYAFHAVEGVNPAAIQAMLNAFGSKRNELRFTIGWRPSSENSSVFMHLLKGKRLFSVTIYWFVYESGKLNYSRSVLIKEAKVAEQPISKGRAPNAIQNVKFKAKTFVPSKGS